MLSLKQIAKQRKQLQKLPIYEQIESRVTISDNWQPSYVPKPASSRNRKRFNYLISTSNGWIKFRSSYEVAYAMYLDSKKLKWSYESKTFNFPPRSGYQSYTPDFYLHKDDSYIEIKGNLSAKVKHKLDTFKHCFPKVKLTVLRKKDLEKICPKQFNTALELCLQTTLGA